MDVEEIVEGVRKLQPGEAGSWLAPTCTRTFPFFDPQALLALLANIGRPILDVEVRHRAEGGGYVAYVKTLN